MARKEPKNREKNIVYMASGGICAFPKCGKKLIENPTKDDDAAIIAELAHIVADSRQGPRGGDPLSEADRGKHPNLLLLCNEHHTIIDTQVHTYSVAVLRQMKLDHETWVTAKLTKPSASPAKPLISERNQSTVLPVIALPQAVFSAPCGFGESEYSEVKQRVRYPKRQKESDPYVLTPFVLKDDRLYAFQDLTHPNNPFIEVIDTNKVRQLKAIEMWEDPDWKRVYTNLLNRTLYKYAGSMQIRYDPDHKRFYFPTNDDGSERSVTYRSPNRDEQNKKVAWEARFRHNGESKGFWYHMAAGLKFHQVEARQWVLSIRPERHLTLDGETLLPPDKIGKKITKLKARMYNDKYFGEIVFWRDILSRGLPRFSLDYGSQNAVINVQLVTFDVDWIGIPGDDKEFKNEVYEEDLFTLGERSESFSGEELEWEEWEHETVSDE